VPKVEVGLDAVVGYIDFAVLVGIHRAGIDINVGSSFIIVTRSPRAFSAAPSAAAAIPFPSDDTTPPVKKMNLVLDLGEL